MWFIMLSIFLLSKTLKSLPLKSEIRQTCPWAHSTPRVLANQLSGGKKKVGIYKGEKKITIWKWYDSQSRIQENWSKESLRLMEFRKVTGYKISI